MGLYRNVITGHEAGESFTFTFSTFNAAGTVSGAAAALNTAIGLLWNGVATPADSIKQLIPTTSGIDQTYAVEISALNNQQLGKVVNSVALVGTNANGPLPPQCCCVVSLRSALFTKAGRGRFYLPAFGTDKVSGGRILNTAVGQVATAAQKMVQSLNGAGYTVCIYHRATKTHDNVVTVDVGDVFDTQRRRRDKLTEVRTSLAV